MSDANRDSNFRKLKGVEYVSANNPNKGFSGNHKTKHAVHTSDRKTGAKTCLCMDPSNISKSEKFLSNTPKVRRAAASQVIPLQRKQK